ADVCRPRVIDSVAAIRSRVPPGANIRDSSEHRLSFLPRLQEPGSSARFRISTRLSGLEDHNPYLIRIRVTASAVAHNLASAGCSQQSTFADLVPKPSVSSSNPQRFTEPTLLESLNHVGL